MTDTSNQRPFRPIYPATIVPGEIESRTNVKGDAYLVIPNTTVTSLKSGKAVTRTAMVFGKSVAAIGDMLKTGVAVDLAVQQDEGSIKIIGEILPPKAAAQG